MSQPALWTSRTQVLRVGRIASFRFDLRAVVLAAVLAAVLVVGAAVALTLGEAEIASSQVLAALLGSEDSGVRRIVVEWRLARVALAVAGGTALAISGAIFQSMTRNPLGSPDVIGFSTGAYTGALLTSLVLGASGAAVSGGALLGGLGTAALVYALAFRRGVLGFRLIVVGVAVSATLSAVNSYMLVRARLEEAVSAATWGAGTLNGARWPDVLPVAISLLLVPVAMATQRRLSLLELGDDHARALGLRVERTRLILLGTGVGLVAIVTSVSGPISFVALAAPQIARRLLSNGAPALLTSALVGAVLLLLSDLLAQRLIAPAQLPVGVVTACLGGVYLSWLLTRAGKKT